MLRSNPSPVPAYLLGLVLAALALPAADTASLDNLIANSPFGGVPGAGHGRGEQAAPLEFRGVLYEGATAYFSVYEASTRQSAWVGLNEAGLNYQVKSYDAANARLQVDYQGRALTLPLVQAPHSAARPMLPLAAAPAQPGNNGPAVTPPAPNPQLPAQIAEEIRRRRALRQQATPIPPAPPAPPSSP